MIILLIYLIFSFILDAFSSLYLNFSLETISIFKTIYTIISLIVIYNYFKNKNKYIIILILFGILFDIVYTNTFILNIIIFLVIYMIINYLDYLMPNNIFTINIKSVISIITYYILTYLIMLLSNYSIYPFNLLLKIITHSILMTVIYTTISYLILKRINIKEIR